MNRPFKEELPQQFVENTISLCGSRGRKWLDDLPKIVKKLESEWSIVSEGHLRNLSFNYVAKVTQANGEKAILKIALPLDDPEIFGEAAYLELLDGQGAAKLRQLNREHQAILIECVVPGTDLKSVCRNDQSKAVTIAADMLRRILRPAPESLGNFIRLDDWFWGLGRAAESEFPKGYAERALKYYAELSAPSSNDWLIHGDLHHTNILAAKREPYLMIDPKGIVGHFGYDIGVFLNNHHNWLEWNTRLEGKLDKAVAEFASAFELEETVVRKWAFCQMVLSWWWMFDEMPDIFGDELGLSDIWKV